MLTANDREVAIETGIRWLACDIFKDKLLGSLIYTNAFLWYNFLLICSKAYSKAVLCFEVIVNTKQKVLLYCKVIGAGIRVPGGALTPPLNYLSHP